MDLDFTLHFDASSGLCIISLALASILSYCEQIKGSNPNPCFTTDVIMKSHHAPKPTLGDENKPSQTNKVLVNPPSSVKEQAVSFWS